MTSSKLWRKLAKRVKTEAWRSSRRGLKLLSLNDGGCLLRQVAFYSRGFAAFLPASFLPASQACRLSEARFPSSTPDRGCAPARGQAIVTKKQSTGLKELRPRKIKIISVPLLGILVFLCDSRLYVQGVILDPWYL